MSMGQKYRYDGTSDKTNIIEASASQLKLLTELINAGSLPCPSSMGRTSTAASLLTHEWAGRDGDRLLPTQAGLNEVSLRRERASFANKIGLADRPGLTKLMDPD